jgi:hypothetical protein
VLSRARARASPHPARSSGSAATAGASLQAVPVFVFPRDTPTGGDEDGCYIHWISAIDPARRTEMIMQGIAAVHHYEGRGLKAALERAEGLAPAGAAPRASQRHDVGRRAGRVGERAAR